MLESVDLKKTLTKSAYDKQMRELQERLRTLQYEARDAQIPIIICLEGWDTAGKGQVVKKLTERLDPRLFRVVSGKPPTILEQRYHFLWRYQVALPNDGEMAVLDHSWYGRVLVERVDHIVKKAEWSEAYAQVNEFERWLADDNQVIVKFWMHISKKEQKKRFRACLKDPLLRWKITKEYKRHHRQYDRWVEAVDEMVARTDTPHAPWTVVESNDLRFARVKVFRTLVAAIEASLEKQKKKAAPQPQASQPKKRVRVAKPAVAAAAAAASAGASAAGNGQPKHEEVTHA
jgi:AMP-polyphosphate phosphotransferase